MDTTPLQTSIDSFGLSNPRSLEDVLFLEEIGTILLESVLLQYMLSLESVARAEFEAWVEVHASTPDFLQKICTSYPTLELLLTQEIEVAKAEVSRIVPV